MSFKFIDSYISIYKNIEEDGGITKDLAVIPPKERLGELLHFMETIRVNKKPYPGYIQSFLITFTDKFLREFEYNPKSIDNYVFDYLVKNMNLGIYDEFYYVVEYGSTNRIHIHGVFINNSKKHKIENWFVMKGFLSKRFGRMCNITSIKYPLSYIEYMYKEPQNKKEDSLRAYKLII